MIIDFHKSFHKQAVSLKPAQKKRLKEALLLFADEPYHSDLYNHPLTGEWTGFRSISFGGDWRAHYKIIDDNSVLFVAVGTHGQLYK
ncbi:MAG TPA: type II toxin-antitoxin system mRNA interferase toxin, RelE/StbE family [Candidatus Saccharimonadales bacterium]|nr:type II toxin-antitoxin system mRNA interferase toxin, RelE/StbE family [Candidatus Saccharimonadales bacterium]